MRGLSVRARAVLLMLLASICVAAMTTNAFELADASAVMALELLELPVTALSACLLSARVPSVWTWIGGGIILASTSYGARREVQVERVPATGATGPEPLAAPPARSGC